MRIWQLYRVHTLKKAVSDAVDSGKLSSEDAAAANKFCASSKTSVSMTNYILTKNGYRPDLESDEGFLATDRCMTAIGMSAPGSILTAEDFESQF